jgi:phosphatidylserine decarboxylase
MVRDGYIYGLSLLAVAAVLAWATGNWAWSIAPVLLAAFFLWFFRDPQRTIPTGPGLIVSPGDGLVTETASINTPEGPRQRISIFLSVFDVHVNRSPIGGVLTSVRYQKGQYLNAMNPRRRTATSRTSPQSAARAWRLPSSRLPACWPGASSSTSSEGDTLARGQRVGLIKFGSRVTVLLPAEAILCVKVGQRVQGGSSVLASMAELELASVASTAKRSTSASVLPNESGGGRL